MTGLTRVGAGAPTRAGLGMLRRKAGRAGELRVFSSIFSALAASAEDHPAFRLHSKLLSLVFKEKSGGPGKHRSAIAQSVRFFLCGCRLSETYLLKKTRRVFDPREMITFMGGFALQCAGWHCLPLAAVISREAAADLITAQWARYARGLADAAMLKNDHRRIGGSDRDRRLILNGACACGFRLACGFSADLLGWTPGQRKAMSLWTDMISLRNGFFGEGRAPGIPPSLLRRLPLDSALAEDFGELAAKNMIPAWRP